jgi:hypothetical protein
MNWARLAHFLGCYTTGKVPHFDGINFAKSKYMMKAYLVGLHPELWEIVKNGVNEPIDPSNPTPLEYRHINLNGQTTSVLLRTC